MQAELSEQLWLITALWGCLFCCFSLWSPRKYEACLYHFLACYWDKPPECADPRGAVSPCSQRWQLCHHHSLMKIEDDWLVFCPVSSVRGKTLEMATSTIPWQSSAYSFLRDERERIRYPGRTNQQMPGQFLCFYVEMRFPSKIYKILLLSQGVSGWQTGGEQYLFHLLPVYTNKYLLFPWW